MREVETRLAPFAKRLGFRPDFSLENFVDCVAVEPERVSGVNFRGFWKLLEFRSPGWGGAVDSVRNNAPNASTAAHGVRIPPKNAPAGG